MYGDKGQPCGYGIEGEFFGECRPELECKYEGPVGLCSTIDDAGRQRIIILLIIVALLS